ncbi:MAG: LysM peptidoglycan-binding domain-containing protein [Clostridia bacterium]|nr:LysM peptidoglycan-binding domain-containing protein [Clostridia bacterium]
MEKFFYRVNSEDTVNLLCSKFNLPIGVFVSINNLKKEIEEGDLVVIEKCNNKLYFVQPLDTIKSVAKKFGTTEERLKELNKVDYIFYGLKIKV